MALVDFLGAPVPYVLGLAFKPPSHVYPKDVVFVDLDTDRITCHEEIPQLPHVKDLYALPISCMYACMHILNSFYLNRRKKLKPLMKNVEKLLYRLEKVQDD